MTEISNGTLLIGMGARLYRAPDTDKLFIEDQTLSGLHGWKQNFDRVVGYGICYHANPPSGWSDARMAGIIEPNFRIIELPDTYMYRTMLKTRFEARKLLTPHLWSSDYRVLTYGGALGDPGEIAAEICRRNGLPHAVWLDRVESKVVLGDPARGWRRLKKLLDVIIVRRNERRAVKEAGLALLHGETVFQHFRPIARCPVLAENIHLSEEDRISPEALSNKLTGLSSEPLSIVYAGRATAMKGATQWVEVLSLLKNRGIEFRATWMGDGDQLARMKDLAASKGLVERDIEFPGFVSDRRSVLEKLRSAHILMFCHLTDESPRILIESLHSGTPIIGYSDPYAEKLVSEKGGGILVARGDVKALADAVADCYADKSRLSSMIQRAAESAQQITREAVFRSRSDAVKEALGWRLHR